MDFVGREALLRQRQEETLHQRERELTALKGALKEEVESHDEEVENLREQYSQDMEVLRRTMEEVSQVGERRDWLRGSSEARLVGYGWGSTPMSQKGTGLYS